VALPRDDVCPYAPRRVSGGDVAGDGARARLYRSLYGFRGAVEEAMLQHPDTSIFLLEGRREPSGTPAANVHGVEIHSGDILVSRGGYPTSTLIARGNDSPGNFSHVGAGVRRRRFTRRLMDYTDPSRLFCSESRAPGHVRPGGTP